mgnify:CR=1 FL=1
MNLWVEKYRPQSLEEYVGNKMIKNKISDYLSQGSIQNLLFHGVAGTGKTTLAKLITNNINCDLLYINASDERGIDTIRDKIIPFASSMGFGGVKIVILDEADYITPQAQATLRNTMESFSGNTRFILTCNYLERIISPLQNRCVEICKVENVVIDNVSLKTIINAHYPDIRKTINTIQGSVIDGVAKLDEASLKDDLNEQILQALSSKLKLVAIRQILADSGSREFDNLFKSLYDNTAKFTTKEGAAILIIAKYQYEYTFVLEKEICVAAMLNELLNL